MLKYWMYLLAFCLLGVPAIVYWVGRLLAGPYEGKRGILGMMTTIYADALTGHISALGSSGCRSTGKITPRASENAYDIEVTFGPVPCSLPGQTVSGVGVYDPTYNSLTVGLVNSGRTIAALIWAEKQ